MASVPRSSPTKQTLVGIGNCVPVASARMSSGVKQLTAGGRAPRFDRSGGIDSQHSAAPGVAEFDGLLGIEADAEHEAILRFRDLLDVPRSRVDAVYLARLPARIEQSVGAERDSLRIDQGP